MTFDYFAWLDGEGGECCSAPAGQAGRPLALADSCAVGDAHDKKGKVQREYRRQVCGHVPALPAELGIQETNGGPPLPGWVSLAVDFEFQRPWFARDDRPFHVLDNPLRKDPVFGTPCLGAASWKGLLRWACRMEAGLLEHLDQNDYRDLDQSGWGDPEWIRHLFGNSKGESGAFRRGALVFYPTWFDRIDFEVINPHNRERRAGTHPIYYEVVPSGTRGRLSLMYAPLPGSASGEGEGDVSCLENLVEACHKLLALYGISAKRTAGWGLAAPRGWLVRGFRRDGEYLELDGEGPPQGLHQALRQALEPSEDGP